MYAQLRDVLRTTVPSAGRAPAAAAVRLRPLPRIVCLEARANESRERTPQQRALATVPALSEGVQNGLGIVDASKVGILFKYGIYICRS